ncbi:MAG TPA: hypothetical protein VFL57_18435 [Bryobacteraceae bacterium]|nr:hypothetical protein [Bryobacteraceae bacterium]
MRISSLVVPSAALAVTVTHAVAQLSLNPFPSRVLGQQQVEIRTVNPNLIEGRELYLPQDVAVDRSGTPSALYVADLGNHRVLAWRDAATFRNGAPADLVIGQVNKTTALPLGPGLGRATGLNSPSSVAVDAAGNLWVHDTGNNRVLRFPKPFAQTDEVAVPDMVIGQTSFSSRDANAGGRSAHSLASVGTFGGGSGPATSRIAFDPQGNLWVVDPYNHRVLRFPAAALAAGRNGPDADLVLGQFDFSEGMAAPQTAEGRLNRTNLALPAAIGIDSRGRVFVGDSLNRVLVWTPPLRSGQAAARIMGVFILPEGQTLPAPNEYLISSPEGIFFVGDSPVVVDARFNRALRFDPFEQWPAEGAQISPPARAIIGQASASDVRPNRGLAEPNGGTLLNPNSGTTGAGFMFIADTRNHRVLAYPNEGRTGIADRVLGQDTLSLNAPNLIEGRELALFFGTAPLGTLGGAFTDGAGIALDRRSSPPHLFVADTYNNRILGWRDARRAKQGDKADLVLGQTNFQRALVNSPFNSTENINDTGLFLPAGLAVDRDGNLYVADSGNGRVLRYAAPFERAVPEGNLYAANLVLGQTGFFTHATDPTARIMGRPFGLAFTAEGHLVVSDALHHRVLLFRRPAGGDFANGQAAALVVGQSDFLSGGRGTGPNRLFSPRHVAIDTDDRLYVADAGNNRIVVYDRISDPRLASDPSPVISIANLSSPHGVYVSEQTGEIWVAQPAANRAVRLPRFDLLGLNPRTDFEVVSERPLAITQDTNGNLYIAEGANRVAMFFSGVAPVNAASGNDQGIAPGMITSVYPQSGGQTFGDQTAGATTLPLPTELADIQVLVNDRPAPLFYVSPGQINFVTPSDVPESGFAEIQVVRRSVGQVLGSTRYVLTSASPALFTISGAGTGQVAAINEDGTANSPTNRIGRRKVVQLFATGMGVVPGAPPDGVPASGPVPTDGKPRVIIGNDFVPDDHVEYSGLAPGLPGVWQINVRIPASVDPSGTHDVVIVYRSRFSNLGKGNQRIRTTIATGP